MRSGLAACVLGRLFLFLLSFKFGGGLREQAALID